MNDPSADAPTQPLALKSIDCTRAEPLLRASFSVPAGQSFFDDFPAWKSPKALWLGLLDSSGTLQAAAGMLPGEWMVPGRPEPLRLMRIGGVVTAADRRGQGLASQLVQELIARAEVGGAQAVVLWGQDSPLYRRLGFEPLGRQIRSPWCALVSTIDRVPGCLRLEEGYSSDLFLALSRRRREAGGVLLSTDDAEDILKYRHTRWARVLDGANTLVGYGAFGKGIDLGFQVHEWSGTAEALRMLGRWALSLDGRAEIMGSQPELEAIFGELPGESIVEPLCLARVADPVVAEYLHVHEDRLWFWGLDGV